MGGASGTSTIDTAIGSHNMGYVMRANSSVLVLRLVSQSSLATLPFCRRPAPSAVLAVASN